MANVTSGLNYIVQPSLQFNNPVSEASLSALGSTINGLLDVLAPVGTLIHSGLTFAQFTTIQTSGSWVPCDGRSCLGTTYATVTGATNVPDFGGRFLRIQNTPGGSSQNPDNTALLGTQGNQNANHNHGLTDPGHAHNWTAFDGGLSSTGGRIQGSNNANPGPVTAANNFMANSSTGISIASSGGNESRPEAATVNLFIRVN